MTTQSFPTFLIRTMVALSLAASSFLVLSQPADARVCTSISPIFGVGELNCSSSGDCDGKAVGAGCPGGSCTAFATRFNSACCTCENPNALARKCVAKRQLAEAKYVLCHAKANAKAANKGLDPDYGKCIDQFLTAFQKVTDKFGPDCPQAVDPNAIVNTYASLMADPGTSPAQMMLCGPDTQWDPVQQLCVSTCVP